MSKEEPDIFCCSICLEHFKKPKLLPCQHTFCESCLHTYIQSSAGNDTLFPKWFLCPLCRQTVKSPNINSKPREWASLMPVNNMIISLMQTSEAGAAFNEANESRKCGPCKRDEEISTGSYWCPNCLEFLCENCKKFHRRMKISEMHKMIPVEEMDKEHTKVTEIDEPCPDHVGEILKVFCISHNTMCCVMCLATHHNECKEIKTLEEMANQMEGDQSGRRFINKLSDIKAKLGEIAKNRQENVEYLNGRSKMVMDEVKVIVDQAKSNLDAFLEDFESKLTSLNEQENEKLSMTKEKIECLLRSFEYGEQILNFLSKNGHPKQQFIEKEKFKMQILNHLNQLKLDSGVDEMVDYYFTADELLIKLKNPMSVQKLGQVETKYETNKKEIMPVIAELCSTCDQDMYKQRLLLSADISEFEAMKLWDVKGNGCISGGLFLSNGTFVCCDCENQTLNAYDKHGNFLFDLKLEYHPLTMDIAFDKEIVVLGHKKPQIYTYDIKQTEFVELQKIKIPYQAKGMTVLENRIIITDGQHVDIMTVFGSKLQSITVRDFSAKDFCFIAADKSSIYYHFQDLLMKISLSRNDVKKVFNVPSKLEKKSKNGIAIDHFGNKYLCVGNSICVLSKDCKKYCLFKTNIQTFAMGFQKNGSRFFVSNSQTSTESIMFEVYEIYLKK